MISTKDNNKNISEEKKEEIIENLVKKEKISYHSKTFIKIANEVKEDLKNQKTDDALRNITL